MAAFNFPVDADILRQRINPALSLDLDGNKQAWVSILSSTLVKTTIDGVTVPLIKPSEVQVRTYVTGPDPKTKETIKGVWLFDLLLQDHALPSAPVIDGAKVLFGNSIRVDTGKINVAANSSSYNLAGLDLQVASKVKADVSAKATILQAPATAAGEWFLHRDVWFGQNKGGELTASQLHGNKHFSNLTQMLVSDFSSTVLKSLALGADFGKEVFAQHPEASFFIGGVEATWSSSVVVSSKKVPEILV